MVPNRQVVEERGVEFPKWGAGTPVCSKTTQEEMEYLTNIELSDLILVSKDRIVSSNEEQSKWTYTKILVLLTILTIITGSLIYIYSYKRDLVESLKEEINTRLRLLYCNNETKAYVFFLSVLLAIAVSGLPLKTWFSMLVFFIINDNMKSFVFFLASSVSNSILLYLIMKVIMRNKAKKSSENALIAFLTKETEKQPWRTAGLTRILSLPDGIKDYLLILAGMPFPIYLLTGLIDYTIHSIIFVILFDELKAMDCLLDGQHTWKDKTTLQKSVAVIGIILAFITTCIIVIVSIYITKKIRKKSQVNRLKNAI